MAKKTIRTFVQDRFDYDIDALAPYVDEQNEDILQELLVDSLFMGRCNIMSGVKGSEKIKMLASTLILQEAATCGWSPEGGMVFTDKTISNLRIKFQEDYCNEDLNGAWTQMKNRIGANLQDMENPFGDVIIAYKIMQLRKAIQDLLLNGDTTSLNAQLAFMDGLVKQWKADALVTAVTRGANDFATLKAIADATPLEVRANNIDHEVICDELLMQGAIDWAWNNKDFNALITFTRNSAGELEFVLPTTTTRFRSVAQLAGTSDAFLVSYPFISIAVDGDKDEEGIEVKYNETDEKLRVGSKFRLGTTYVFPQYFKKLAPIVS
jgi:hypothetical protein